MATYRAISLISEAFDRHNIKYQIIDSGDFQEIQAGYGIKAGPLVAVRFISRDRKNDLEIRVIGLVNGVPEEKRPKLLAVCNTLNCRYRFVKFCMNDEGNISVELDTPTSTGDESVGEMAFELFVRTVQIMNMGYPSIAQVLYAPEEPAADPEAKGGEDLLKMLKDEEISIRIRKMTPSGGEEASGDAGQDDGSGGDGGNPG